MKRIFLLFIYTIIAIDGLSQERQFTEFLNGGSEKGLLGKINDEINISPTGQLSYEIPIPTLPGTGGMKPNLSVKYNNSIKNGLFGYGFELIGLSIINRIPSDYFHDGKVSVINFTDDDHFALDGQRLVSVSNPYLYQIEYRFENNTFTKILSKGRRYNPISFKAYTKSGLIYDYISAAKALGREQTDSTMFWLVSKVSDTKGNYFTINYDGDATTNEFYPTRIDYTGNDEAGLIPYASLRLNYISNPYSPDTYVSGIKVRNSKIISCISLFIENQEVKTFNFEYQIVNHKYQLSKVTERASNGEFINPTKFTWENLSDFKVEKCDYSQTSQIHKATLAVGDFNGDGLADFLAFPENENAGWDGWKLFVSHGTSFELVATGNWNFKEDKLEQVLCGDFNGDGYTDVVIKRCHSGKWHNCDLYITSVSKEGNVNLSFSKCILSLNTDYNIQSVELNGDGASDLFAWLLNSKECKLIISSPITDGINPLGYTAERYCSEIWDRVEFGDFNGDGLTDVMNLTDDSNYIMYSDGVGTLTSQKQNSWPNKHHYMELGDFNGDGKTDMLLTGWSKDPNISGWNEWCVNYSKGDFSFDKQYFTKPFDARTKQLFIADFNGDGFDDFQAIDNTSSGYDNTFPQVYLNDGRCHFYNQSNGSAVYATDKWHFYTGDFNGDGKIDFVCTSNWSKSNWDGYQLYLMPSHHHNILKGIKDGLGNYTEIEYKYLSDNSVFKRGNTIKYPIVSVGLSWPVVASVLTPNGIGGVNRQSYKYEDALLHKNGRGILGFARTVIKDETTNTITTTDFSVNEEKYILAPTRLKTAVNGNVIEETEYSYTLNSNYDSPNDEGAIFTYLPEVVSQKSYEFNTGELIKDVSTRYEYDNYGNTTKVIVKDGEIETCTINKFSNDVDKWFLGRLSESINIKSNENEIITKKSTFQYDSDSGLLIEEVFAPEAQDIGYKKTYVHDSYGNIIKSKTSSIDCSLERITQTTYDEKGRFVVSLTNPLGFTETSTYDEITGLVSCSKDLNGIDKKYGYDAFGNCVSSSTPISTSLKTVGWSAGMSDAPEYALYFEWIKNTGEPFTIKFYDCLGRLLRTVTESLNGKKIYVDQTYNYRGLIEKTSEPYFKGDIIFWNKNEYDEVGRTKAQTLATGNQTIYSYNGLATTITDPLGNLSTKICNLNGLLESSIDNAGTEITYKYNPDGNCIKTEGPRNVIRCFYDIAGNRTSFVDSDLGYSKDKFNAFGEIISHIDNYGETKYVYDRGGRLVKEIRPDVIISYIYDNSRKGFLYMTISEGSIYSANTFYYDSYGRAIKKITTINNNSYEIEYTYNSNNQIETITYPTKFKVIHNYDDCGILTSVTDAFSRKLYWKLLKTNSRNQIEEEVVGNGPITTTSYNAKNGTIAKIETPGIQNWSYNFDAVGNLISRNDLYKNLEESFLYDNLYRLTTVLKNDEETQTLTYDNAGNIISKSDVGNFVYYDGTNRLNKIVDCQKQLPSLNQIVYNTYNKIIKITSGERTMTIDYGPDKSRVMCEIAGIKKYYIDNLFEQKIENEKIININYVYACGKAVAIVTESINEDFDIKYLHRDHLGSIQAISDKGHNLFQELSYDAWGARRNPETWEVYQVGDSIDVYNEHGFGGHEHIDLFDLINMDGRIYNPIIGRFLSPDPFIQSPDVTQSLNRYAYCVNNPLSLIDPSGYSWLSDNWKPITASAVGIAVSVLTLGTGTSVGAAIIAGAAGGAASALTGALLNGANIGQIAKSTFTGATLGAASGFLNFASGGGTIFEQLFKHTFSQGWIEGVQGGDILHGFMMGAVSGLGGYVVNSSPDMSKILKLTSASVISGTIDEIGGGKFANGAVTGAFSFLFNDYLHHRKYRMQCKDICLVSFTHDTYVLGSASIKVDSYVLIDDYIQEKILSVEAILTSYSNAPIDIQGQFGSELTVGRNISELPFRKPVGSYVVPSGTNFTGRTDMKWISYRNSQPVNLTIIGNWRISSDLGRSIMGLPFSIGSGIPYRYKLKFKIK